MTAGGGISGRRLLRIGLTALGLAAAPGLATAVEGPGAQIYRTDCAGCHGERGEARAMGKSAALAGMPATSVRDALAASRAAPPKTAAARAKAALSGGEADAVAAFLAGLPRP